MNKAPSIPSLASIGSKSKKFKRKISMSKRRYTKDKNVIMILVLITIMFTISTIPSGFVKVLKQFFDTNWEGNKSFLVSFATWQKLIKVFSLKLMKVFHRAFHHIK